MHISSLFHPELAAAKPTAARPIYESVYLATDPDGRATLTAADNHILVQVPVERAPDDVDGGLLPAVFSLASRAAGRRADRYQLTATADTLAYPTPTGWIRQERRPTGEVLPPFADKLPTGRPRVRLALDMTQLARLAKALGSPLLLLDVYDPDRPYVVRPLSHTTRGALGLVMPFNLATFDLEEFGDAPEASTDSDPAETFQTPSTVPLAAPVTTPAVPDPSLIYS